MQRIFFALLIHIVAFCPAPLAAQKQTGLPPDLDANVARVMKTFEVPGIGLAIVKDGNLLLRPALRH